MGAPMFSRGAGTSWRINPGGFPHPGIFLASGKARQPFGAIFLDWPTKNHASGLNFCGGNKTDKKGWGVLSGRPGDQS